MIIASTPRTTIGIVAYHRPGPLTTLLHALAEEQFDVVVINVDGDAEVRQVGESRDGVRVVDVSNRGYASAVNALAAVAKGDTVVFTNDDVVVDAETLRLLAAVIQRGEADVAVPRVLQPDGAAEGSVLALPTPSRLLVEWAILPDAPPADGRAYGIEKWRRPSATQPVEASTAVMVAVRADLLRSVPLPENYFLYWEELEWFWWLRAAGRHVVIVPDATIIHAGGRADVRPEKSALMARNAVRCVRRTQGRTAAVAALFVVVLWNLRLVAVDAARASLGPTSARRSRVHARWTGLRAALGSWTEIR